MVGSDADAFRDRADIYCVAPSSREHAAERTDGEVSSSDADDEDDGVGS